MEERGFLRVIVGEPAGDSVEGVEVVVVGLELLLGHWRENYIMSEGELSYTISKKQIK